MLIKQDCLLQHGIAVVTCLLAGIEAFGYGLPSESVLVSIIKGLHGFHIYSKEYWTEYLLSLLPSLIGPGSTTSSLYDLAFELATNLNQLSMNADTSSGRLQSLLGGEREPKKFIDGRIGTLQSSMFQNVLNGCLKARSEDQLETELQDMEAKSQSINGAAMTEIPSPQEGVSLILQKYQATIRYVLDQPDYPGATAAELESFKRHFRDCAYTCRVKGCIRATEGFERLAQCLEHEVLHVRRLRCPQQGCRYPPFVSSRALRAHVNKDHNPTPKSKSIRKMGVTRTNLHGTAAGSPAVVDHTRTLTPLNIPGPMLPESNAYVRQLEMQVQSMKKLKEPDIHMREGLRYNAGPTIQRNMQASTAAANVAGDSTEATLKLPYLSMALDCQEYLETKLDMAGEQKIDSLGALMGNRAYRFESFVLPHRGSTRFMLASESLFILGYRDTYSLFNENKSLLEITATDMDKSHLITTNIIPIALIPVELSLVTARSMFRQFGSKLIVNGQVGLDDYWGWGTERGIFK